MKELNDKYIARCALKEAFPSYMSLQIAAMTLIVLPIIMKLPVYEKLSEDGQEYLPVIIMVVIAMIICEILKRVLYRNKTFKIYNDKIMNVYNSKDNNKQSTNVYVNFSLKDGKYFRTSARKAPYMSGTEVFSIRDEYGIVYGLFAKDEYIYAGTQKIEEIPDNIPFNNNINEMNTFGGKNILTREIIYNDLKAISYNIPRYTALVLITLTTFVCGVCIDLLIPIVILPIVYVYILYVKRIDKNIFIDSGIIKEITIDEKKKTLKATLMTGESCVAAYQGVINSSSEIHIIRTQNNKKIVAIYPKNTFDIKL